MNSQLYSLIYCSRNRIRGNNAEVAAELQSILNASRVNNAKAGITGALLYNAGCFAQILEGPLSAVERAFEIIQRDVRHSEVTVIQSGPAEARQFPAWSMAFAGNSSIDRIPSAAVMFDAVFTNAADAGESMLALLKDLIVREDDWVMLDAA